MISEIANSLFLTYLASEYLVSSSLSPPSPSSRSRAIQQADKDEDSKKSTIRNNYTVLGWLSFLVGIANLLDHHYYLSLVWGYARTIDPKNSLRLPPYYITIPTKVFMAATSYALALYVDIHRDRSNRVEQGHSNTKQKMPFRSVFLPKVGWAFLKILPAYPFLAVLISFVFLFVIDLWEHVFHLPLEWLNNPIYYGTLYGPFAYTYVHVKREVLRRNHYDWKTEYGSRSVPTDAFV